MPVAVYNVGVAVEDSRTPLALGVPLQLGGDVGEYGGTVEFVAGIEKEDIVAGGKLQGFVHGIVDAVVGLRTAHNLMLDRCQGVALLVEVDECKRFVLAVAVDDQMFYAGMVL